MDLLDPIEDEIQAAMRKAHIFQSRGDNDAAIKVLEEVVAKYPNHPAAMEAKGDILAAVGKHVEARDIYKAVIDLYPGRIVTERKHAQMVLKIAERDAAVAALMSEGPALLTPAGAKRHGGIAASFSLLAPGFGQIYNGEFFKGGVMLVVAVALWFLFFSIGTVVRGDGEGASRSITSVGWIIFLILAAFYVACVVDAAVGASRREVGPPPERPKPPVDKPFE